MWILAIYLILIGVALYLVNNLIPMDQKIRLLINVLTIVFVCLWLLSELGLLPAHFGHLR